jgi:ribosomal protein S12 methylthiotransferase accessory factor
MLSIAEAEAGRLGAVRPAELSGLDRFAIPCCQVTRPAARNIPGNVSVTTGKGWTPAQARLGALMEFLERHWAENPSLACEIALEEDFAKRGERFVPPASVPLPENVPDPAGKPLAWFRGATLAGDPVWVPAHDVAAPFAPPPGAHNPPAVWRSTGLAAGSDLDEAVLHGLLEVCERDAVAAAQLAHTGATVDPASIDSERVQDVVQRARALEMEIEFKLLSAPGGVYAAAAVLGNPWESGLARLVCGHGAHVDFTLAAEAALLEALQSRAAFIAGAREDLERFGEVAALSYAEARESLRWWITPADPVPAPIGRPGARDPGALAREIAAKLVEQGFDPPVYVKLSSPASPVVVVKVIVPGCSDVSEGRWRIGRRFRALQSV